MVCFDLFDKTCKTVKTIVTTFKRNEVDRTKDRRTTQDRTNVRTSTTSLDLENFLSPVLTVVGDVFATRHSIAFGKEKR